MIIMITHLIKIYAGKSLQTWRIIKLLNTVSLLTVMSEVEPLDLDTLKCGHLP